MIPYDSSSGDPLQALANKLDCITEQDLCFLFAITPGTAEAWRKRRRGPAYSLVGNRVLYPRQSVQDFMEKHIRGGEASTANSFL